MIQIEQITLAHFLRIGECRYQHPTADTHFAHAERLGHSCVSVRVHPGRTLRADPTHDVVAHPKTLASPEIRVSALMLPYHHVNAQLCQQRNQKIARVVPIRDDHVTATKLLGRSEEHTSELQS